MCNFIALRPIMVQSLITQEQDTILYAFFMADSSLVCFNSCSQQQELLQFQFVQCYSLVYHLIKKVLKKSLEVVSRYLQKKLGIIFRCICYFSNLLFKLFLASF